MDRQTERDRKKEMKLRLTKSDVKRGMGVPAYGYVRTFMVHVAVRGAYVLNMIHGTNVKLPDDDMEMSKHVGVYI
jgi:hypothetical protein